ncbi:MAG: DUF4174 domain-containing protein [Paracoccaceae bacterium]|nr:DUF4174 domain-containing protein [Paracoccaceae bacterium]MDG1738091.1 DUF4174 domain-containing protein [Paracoccaceae bacterium]MDG2256944.1 DUF4174 domain-containing protein [Paracoccaceae bacterium]
MRAFTALVLSVTLAFPAFSQEAVDEVSTLKIFEASEVDLLQFTWTDRPILVFADSPFDPRFEEQIELLKADAEELMIRDVVVITDTDPAGMSELRKELRPRGFGLVLLGKDGQVKLRKPSPWDVREITHAIDKWPIRLKEIRDEQGKS